MATHLETVLNSSRKANQEKTRAHHTTTAKRAPIPPANRAAACVGVAAAFDVLDLLADEVVLGPLEDRLVDELGGGYTIVLEEEGQTQEGDGEV